MFWFWFIPIAWILGAILFYIADGWFDYNLEGGEYFAVSILWPVVLPVVIVAALHDALKNYKITYAAKKEKAEKIRIAQEQEIEKIAKELPLNWSEEFEKVLAEKKNEGA